jgi:hypothetical protein
LGIFNVGDFCIGDFCVRDFCVGDFNLAPDQRSHLRSLKKNGKETKIWKWIDLSRDKGETNKLDM